MASRRGDAKAEVERIAGLFENYIGKPITFSFGRFSFQDVVIESIQLAKLTDMKNAPDKRKDDDGKMYTPPVMQFNTNAGLIYFVLEDIEIVSIAGGYRIITAAVHVEFRT